MHALTIGCILEDMDHTVEDERTWKQVWDFGKVG